MSTRRSASVTRSGSSRSSSSRSLSTDAPAAASQSLVRQAPTVPIHPNITVRSKTRDIQAPTAIAAEATQATTTSTTGSKTTTTTSTSPPVGVGSASSSTHPSTSVMQQLADPFYIPHHHMPPSNGGLSSSSSSPQYTTAPAAASSSNNASALFDEEDDDNDDDDEDNDAMATAIARSLDSALPSLTPASEADNKKKKQTNSKLQEDEESPPPSSPPRRSPTLSTAVLDSLTKAIKSNPPSSSSVSISSETSDREMMLMHLKAKILEMELEKMRFKEREEQRVKVKKEKQKHVSYANDSDADDDSSHTDTDDNTSPLHIPIKKEKVKVKQEIKQEASTHSSRGKDEDNESEAEEEEKVKIKERKDKDVNEEIDEEDERNDPYQSYNRWLRVRHKLYPLKKHQRMYNNRYTLLGEQGRLLEYFRFGMVAKFPASLYPSLFHRFYKQKMIEAQLMKDDSKTRNAVSQSSLTVPPFYYDKRDIRTKMIHREDDDLPSHAYSLGSIEEELKVTPPPIAGVAPTTMQEVVTRAINQLKSLQYVKSQSKDRVSRGANTVEKLGGSENDSSSDSDSDIEGRTTSSSETMPPLEAVSTSLLYSNPQAAQETIKRIEMQRKEDAARRGIVISTISESPSKILSSIWPLLDDNTRTMISVIRTTTTLKASELAKREKVAIEKVAKFNGDPNDAPSYLTSLCIALGECPFEHDHCMRIIHATMTGTAAVWLATAIQNMSTLITAEQRIALILGQFRQYYITAAQIAIWRSQLTSMKLTATADRFITLIDLENHYASFSKVVRNLSLSDRKIEEREAINDYILTLPQFMFTYIGGAHQQMNTLVELHRYSVGAIKPTISTANNKSNKHSTVDVNPLTDSNNRSSHSAAAKDDTTRRNKQKKSKEEAMKDMICFHCGGKEHNVYICERVKQGQPQTPRGLQAWAEYCKRTGRTNTAYDVQRLIDKREAKERKFRKDKERRKNNDSSNADNGQSSWRKKDSIAVDAIAALTAAIQAGHVNISSSSTTVSTTSIPANSTALVPTTTRGEVNIHTVSIIDTGSEYIDKVETISDRNNDQSEIIELHSCTDNHSPHSQSLCLPVEMNGTPVGHALVDSGCNRVLIRREAVRKYKLEEHTVLFPVTKLSIKTASGHQLPITSRFMTDMTVNNIPFNKHTVVYVVEPTQSHDIHCDVILGLEGIAKSKYRLLDTEKARLVARDNHNNYLQCLAAEIGSNVTGGVVPLTTQPYANTTHSAVALAQQQPLQNVMHIKVKKVASALTPRNKHTVEIEQRQQRRKEAYMLSAKERESRIEKYKELVNSRVHIDDAMKMHLLHYLSVHVDDYSIDRKLDRLEELEKELYRDIDRECIDKVLDAFMHTKKGSDEEEKILTNLFEIYIPEFINKKIETANVEHEEDEATAEIESVDHPLSAPTVEPITPSYIKEKEAAIAKMVNDNQAINSKQKQQLIELLLRHQDRFSLKGENMGQTKSVEHEIDTANNRPFRERLRTYSPSIQEIIDVEIQRMLKEGVIQPSHSPYATNLLLVRKPDPSSVGGVKNRVCASFVKLNDQTVKDSYPLPNIQVLFDKLGSSKWFTTMDLLQGFWQIFIKEEHRAKTAVITARGLFEFVVMPFGLCNAPATFQRLMDTVIKPQYRSFIETYIDDIMVHSRAFDDHLLHLDTLLHLLKEHQLVVKLTKCKFAQLAVKFLGHILSHNKLQPNPEAVAKILQWQRPVQDSNKKKALRGFLRNGRMV